MNINAKVTQPASEDRKSSAPASMILLPDGILDFSDELSNDGDDLLDDENNDLKLKRPPDSSHEVGDSKMEKATDDGARAKLRIKTGGEFKIEIPPGKRIKMFFFLVTVRRSADERLIGSMLGEDGESDFDSSLEYNAGEGDSDDSELNIENDPAANVEALYNFSEHAPPGRVKSAKPKTYQSDEDF